MVNQHEVGCAVVLGLVFLAAGCAGSPQPADLVLRHTAVVTLDARRPRAEAVAVTDGRLVFVGTDAAVAPWIGPRTRVLDLAGGMVLPGFQDSHTHLADGGVELGDCRLDAAATPEEVLAEVGRFAAAHPERPWILGGGWQLPVFPHANPHKRDLDALVPDRPVALSAADGHSLWVNTRALALAGITAATPDPPNGRIERDPATGEPTGTLRESAADLVGHLIPGRTPEERIEGLRRALQLAAAAGITSLQDASATPEELDAYAALDRSGELTVRVTAALLAEAEKGIAQIPELVRLRRVYSGRRLRAGTVKLFVDGVIEARTAALLEPYLGSTDRGRPNWEPAALDAMVAALDREGFQIHVHAIGDRAVRITLDAFEKARAANGPRDARHQIAHLELIDPQDIPRFQRLGVIADFQPLWAYEDAYIQDLTVPVLGPERSRWLYPIGSVAKTGAVVVGGSDWPVSSMNPLEAIQVGLTRRDPGSGSGPAWLPEQTVDLDTLLAAYTLRGAFAAFQEATTGSLEVGKAADLIVLDRDLTRSPPHEIAKVRVLRTFIDGQEAFASR
ncbi:MAG TPA: amidohydrolase [Acidobacteria bacterium]|nr:amidohydrolase [Acidobacteriota bacterium]